MAPTYTVVGNEMKESGKSIWGIKDIPEVCELILGNSFCIEKIISILRIKQVL